MRYTFYITEYSFAVGKQYRVLWQKDGELYSVFEILDTQGILHLTSCHSGIRDKERVLSELEIDDKILREWVDRNCLYVFGKGEFLERFLDDFGWHGMAENPPGAGFYEVVGPSNEWGYAFYNGDYFEFARFEIREWRYRNGTVFDQMGQR